MGKIDAKILLKDSCDVKSISGELSDAKNCLWTQMMQSSFLRDEIINLLDLILVWKRVGNLLFQGHCRQLILAWSVRGLGSWKIEWTHAHTKSNTTFESKIEDLIRSIIGQIQSYREHIELFSIWHIVARHLIQKRRYDFLSKIERICQNHLSRLVLFKKL